MKWQTKEDLLKLLISLVQYPSITGSPDEITVSEFIYNQLNELDYFKQYTDHLKLQPLEDGRKVVSALVKHSNKKETIVLLSHFDVVDVEDYGKWKDLAFHPRELTEELLNVKTELSDDVQEDLANGDWLFGRGIMDMKPGIALHMAMIERACRGDFDGNLLLVSVPDEEVNSVGMRGVVPNLVELAAKYNLNYSCCLNAEPMFSKYPGDKNHYIYTGSIGKILPGFLCVGKETHVGEPFSGLNATLMTSEISKEMELNLDFCESYDGETTPPPTSLMQRDLKEEYSVQIPHSSVSMFNIVMMNRSTKEMTDSLLQAAEKAAASIEQHYFNRAKAFSKLEPAYRPEIFKVNVFTFEGLYKLVLNRYGEGEIKRRQDLLLADRGEADDREFTIRVVNDLAQLVKDQGPMIILFYSPPFYPAVCSSSNPMIQSVVNDLKSYRLRKYGTKIEQQHYFPGMSDLSYTGIQGSFEELHSLIGNMPLFENGYQLPVEDLQKLNIPVMNLGPLGRDAHKWTERLELNYSFGTLMDLLPYTIAEIFKNVKKPG